MNEALAGVVVAAPRRHEYDAEARAAIGRRLGRASIIQRGISIVFALLAGAGCTKASRASETGVAGAAALSPSPPGQASAGRGAAGSPPGSREGAASASIDTPNYAAAITPSSGCKKAEPCTVSVVLEAKGDYHLNDKYPYRFKAEDPPAAGVTYPKPLVGRDDADIETKKAILKVPFIAQSSGEAEVGGVLSLSVCSAANCLIDRQALKVSVRVDD